MYTVYGKEGCKYCNLLKQDFEALAIDYEYYDIEESPHKRLEYPSDWSTVPAVKLGDKFIGGYEDLLKYLAG